MARQTRATSAADAALIVKFIFWAADIQTTEGVVLIGDAHKVMIDAAARRLYRLLRQEGEAHRAAQRVPRHPARNTPD